MSRPPHLTLAFDVVADGTWTTHSCVYHSFVSDPSPSSSLSVSSPEHFEANPDEMVSRIRFGKYIALAEEMFGDEGKEVLEKVLQEGKIRMKDLDEVLTAANQLDHKSPSPRHLALLLGQDTDTVAQESSPSSRQ